VLVAKAEKFENNFEKMVASDVTIK